MSSALASAESYTREGVATTAAVDLWELLLQDKDINGRMAGLFISQSSDVGDAAEEMLRWRLVYGNDTSGSGGASPDQWDTGYAVGSAHLDTIESFNTTPASGGSPQNGLGNNFNIRAGEQLFFPPGLEPTIGSPGGSGLVNVIRLMAAPADSLTMTSTIFLYKDALF